MTEKPKKKTKSNKLNLEKIDSKKLDKIADILCPSREDYSDELSLLTTKRFK